MGALHLLGSAFPQVALSHIARYAPSFTYKNTLTISYKAKSTHQNYYIHPKEKMSPQTICLPLIILYKKIQTILTATEYFRSPFQKAKNSVLSSSYIY